MEVTQRTNQGNQENISRRVNVQYFNLKIITNKG